MSSERPRFLYFFLDEGGNFDFSPHGTKYFILTAISKERPFYAFKELVDLKYNLVETGCDIEYFHATEDRQETRDRVFEIIRHYIDGIRIDSIIVEKSKTAPALRAEDRFYPEMLGYLLRYIINGYDMRLYREVIVFTDSIPIVRKKSVIEKAVKITLKKMLPEHRFRIYHHASKSNLDLQIADYCNWAIFRKWERNDPRSFELIKNVVKSEFNIFQMGSINYY